MTRVLSEGFELQDTVGLTTTGSINTSIKRSGSASLNIAGAKYITYTVSDLSEFYLRVPFYITGNNTINRLLYIQWRKGTTVLGTLQVNTLGTSVFNLSISGTVASGTITIEESVWYAIEIHVKIDDSVGEIGLKVDGNLDIDYSGDTKPGADANVDNIYIYNNSGGGVGKNTYIYIDDVAINDTAGGVDDSWCGDGRIIIIKPNGDTATLQLTPSAAVGHYTLVDDIPADGDTTYVEGSVDDEEDIYDLAACGLSDVTISRIWTEARAKDTASSGLKVALITKASGGAEVSGGDVELLGTYTTKVLGAEQLVNPVDSAAWEVADIDALQGGPRKRS